MATAIVAKVCCIFGENISTSMWKNKRPVRRILKNLVTFKILFFSDVSPNVFFLFFPLFCMICFVYFGHSACSADRHNSILQFNLQEMSTRF